MWCQQIDRVLEQEVILNFVLFFGKGTQHQKLSDIKLKLEFTHKYKFESVIWDAAGSIYLFIF